MRQDILDAVKTLSLSDSKTLSQKALKLFEEGGELAKAVLPYETAAGTLHRIVHKGNILEEAVDNILVALSIAYSLGYDDDAIASVMQKKSLYWAELQQNESNVTANEIPHEIHVTVESADIESFKDDCRRIGVKPVVLALHTKAGAVLKDVMTSQVVISTTTEAFDAMQATREALRRLGYVVTRSKIEAAPWHPCAPTATNRFSHSEHNYFESHIEVTIIDEPGSMFTLSDLKECLLDTDAHLSNNYFKASETVKTVMVTLRRYTGTLESFKRELSVLKDRISGRGFEYNKKDIVEYSIYDTNTDHDKEWMSG